MYIFCAIDRVTGSLGMKWAMRGNIHGDKEQIVNTTLVAYSCSFSFYDFELNKMQGGTNRHVLWFPSATILAESWHLFQRVKTDQMSKLKSLRHVLNVPPIQKTWFISNGKHKKHKSKEECFCKHRVVANKLENGSGKPTLLN